MNAFTIAKFKEICHEKYINTLITKNLPLKLFFNAAALFCHSSSLEFNFYASVAKSCDG